MFIMMGLTQKCIFNTSKLSAELEYSKRMKVSLEMKFLFFSTLRFTKIFFFLGDLFTFVICWKLYLLKFVVPDAPFLGEVLSEERITVQEALPVM